MIDELGACPCVCMNVCYNVDKMIKDKSKFIDGSIAHKLVYVHALFGMTRVALVIYLSNGMIHLLWLMICTWVSCFSKEKYSCLVEEWL